MFKRAINRIYFPIQIRNEVFPVDLNDGRRTNLNIGLYVVECDLKAQSQQFC